MKKCEFCGKQISYFDQYCDDECHIKANKFYEKGERFGKLFAVINMICVFGIPIGLFMLSFTREVGLTVALASCVILGIMLIILPFPTENMISKFKIQKAVKITRIIGGAVIFLGVLILLLALLSRPRGRDVPPKALRRRQDPRHSGKRRRPGLRARDAGLDELLGLYAVAV